MVGILGIFVIRCFMDMVYWFIKLLINKLGEIIWIITKMESKEINI